MSRETRLSGRPKGRYETRNLPRHDAVSEILARTDRRWNVRSYTGYCDLESTKARQISTFKWDVCP
ncbi:MAG: hypothetical protein ACI8W3_001501, partial [Myxococcota bacterium]